LLHYFALLVYDTLLTLPHEIKLVWRGRIGLAALLYFMARYSLIAFFMINIIVNNTSSISLQVLILCSKYIIPLTC